MESPQTIDWENIGHAKNTTAIAQNIKKILDDVTPTDIAYIMYTSGSTGNPKGVPINHNNLAHYIQNISAIVKIVSDDKCTQLFDISFDLSVHDILLTWLNGACLCIPTAADALAPAKYIQQHTISVWFSVPSTVDIMQRLKLLKPSAFPSIRLSLFCGEALAGKTIESWIDACPNSQCINLYGPTEATIACFSYNIKTQQLNQPITVPIGLPFGNNTARLDAGELQLGGPQLTQGYINNAVKNQAAFTDNNGQRWYKSGDNAEYQNDCYHHLGRSDDQVKINGFRIELQEITHTLKKHAGHLNMRAIAWPLNVPSKPPSLYLFIEGKKNIHTEEEINLISKKNLAGYMQPKNIIWIESLPLNSNGKIDKKQLIEHLNNNIKD
jgi:non-ribosomal peptide synthetase component F